VSTNVAICAYLLAIVIILGMVVSQPAGTTDTRQTCCAVKGPETKCVPVEELNDAELARCRIPARPEQRN
jgi:hypothetical protein